MAIIKRTSKNQISLPKVLLEKLPPCDYFEAEVEHDALVLRPVKIVRLGQLEPGSPRRLADMVGTGTGLFKSAAEVDSHIDEQRSEWDA